MSLKYEIRRILTKFRMSYHSLHIEKNPRNFKLHISLNCDKVEDEIKT